MTPLRRLAQRFLGAVDRGYRRWHRLRPVGPVMYVGRTQYNGPERHFADGTTLRPGDFIGTMHFDNQRLATLANQSPSATGMHFARLVFPSLRRLGELLQTDEAFREIAVVQGMGWFHHGADLGVVNEPVPPGPRRLFLARYMRLLAWAFAPDDRRARSVRPEPTVTWITRGVLMARFARENRHG